MINIAITAAAWASETAKDLGYSTAGYLCEVYEGADVLIADTRWIQNNPSDFCTGIVLDKKSDSNNTHIILLLDDPEDNNLQIHICRHNIAPVWFRI